jgi:hypothetical protein
MPGSDPPLIGRPETQQPSRLATTVDTKIISRNGSRENIQATGKILGSECSICKGTCRAVLSPLLFLLAKVLFPNADQTFFFCKDANSYPAQEIKIPKPSSPPKPESVMKMPKRKSKVLL